MWNELTRFCGATRNVDFVNQTFRYFKNCVTLQTISSSTKFYTISNTFSTTGFFHLRLLHSPTNSVEDRIVNYSLNVLDTSRILTLLFACHTKRMIDDINHAIYILLKDEPIILLYTFKPITLYSVYVLWSWLLNEYTIWPLIRPDRWSPNKPDLMLCLLHAYYILSCNSEFISHGGITLMK